MGTGYFLVNICALAWVYYDSTQRRMNKKILWSLPTLIIGPLVIPVYLAKRPLKKDESREGGFWWNVLKNFAIFWTIITAMMTFTGCVAGASSVDPGNKYEEAGAAMGLMAVFFMMFFVWFFPTVGAAVLGFLMKSDEKEEGPTGPLKELYAQGKTESDISRDINQVKDEFIEDVKNIPEKFGGSDSSGPPSSPSSEPGEDAWWVFKDGETSDKAFTKSELEKMGSFDENTKVCKEGEDEWVEASKVDDLKNLL